MTAAVATPFETRRPVALQQCVWSDARMDRPPAPHAAEPALPASAGSAALRVTVSVLLAVMLLAGAWVRFNGRIAAISPGLAGPAAQVADELGESGRVRGLLELGLLPAPSGPDAVAAMGLSTEEAASLTQAIQRGRLRLVRLPLFDAGAVADPGPGRSVQVSSGGYTRLVPLARQPVVVTLPIARVGTVSFRDAGPGSATVGALTLTGPVQLPALSPGQTLDVGVVAQ